MTTTLSASDIATATPRLQVRSRFVDDVDPGPGFPFGSDLPTTVEQTLALLPTSAFSCWVRDTSGLIGFGRTLRIRARGRDRFRQLSDAWKAITAAAHIEDEVDLLGAMEPLVLMGPVSVKGRYFASSMQEGSWQLQLHQLLPPLR